jgi:HSP20 family protein
MGHANPKVETGKKVHEITPKTAETTPSGGYTLTPFAEMERMMEEFFSRDWMRPRHGERLAWPTLGAPFEGRMPKVDVIDRDEEILVHAELPGVNKKDLDVTLTDDSITIRGETHREEKQKKGDYYRCEIAEGAYARSVALPARIDSEHAKAQFKDGVLELTLPKKVAAKRRSVKID